MRRLLVLLALGAASLWLGAGRAGATNECKGFPACVSVPGPWVAISPHTGAVARWDLACPKGFIVGGIDALVSVKTIDVAFLGGVGGPVTPGVATAADAVLVGTYTGAAPRPTSFRPFIGCIPTSGGGGRETTAYRAAPPFVPAGHPTTRRAGIVRLRPGLDAAVRPTCAPRERLVSATAAAGFYTATPPPPAIATSVRLTAEGGAIGISTSRALPPTLRAEVQVLALCAVGG